MQTTHASDRGVRRARFYMLRNVACPAILVEGGFLSNRAEEGKILTPEYRDVLARAIAEGILDYAGRQTPEPKIWWQRSRLLVFYANQHCGELYLQWPENHTPPPSRCSHRPGVHTAPR